MNSSQQTDLIPADNLLSTSTCSLETFTIPTSHDEKWRFTPLTRLRGLHTGQVGAITSSTVTVDAPCHSSVIVESVSRDDPRLGKAGKPTDWIAAQAYYHFQHATIVTIPSQECLETPVIVTITASGSGKYAYDHLQIHAQSLSRATIVIDLQGGGTYADNIEFLVDQDADLNIIWIIDTPTDLLAVTTHHILLEKNATIHHITVVLGGELIRFTGNVHYAAPGAQAEMLGIYFADDGQHIETRLSIDHSVSHCCSNVIYKGALQGNPHSKLPDTHTVWVGDVLIRPEAISTDTFEINHNLVLSDGVRVDSIPNLEIETGELIQAGHASTTGRYDPNQLFYLLSRGIPQDQARKLIIHGFFGEIISHIPITELCDRITTNIEHKLATNPSVDAATLTI